MQQLKTNINELNITSISYYNSEFWGGFVLEFEIDGFPYNLFTKKNKNGTYYPNDIVHFGNNASCPYCEKGELVCSQLKTQLRELFHRLIEHPSIRLEWLYINHV